MADILRLFVNAKEAFEKHPQSLRGFYEAALAVNQTELHRGKDEMSFPLRDKVYLLGEQGFVEWCLLSYGTGITNYSEDAGLIPYHLPQADFIKTQRENSRTAAFLPMDVPSLQLLIKNPAFDKTYLKFWIGIDQKHVPTLTKRAQN